MNFVFLFSRFMLFITAPCFLAFAMPNAHDNKPVIAHFIVGNTYPYQRHDWKQAINLASSKGINAFALNMGRDDWQIARVADAYDAAADSEFKLFFMFDMTSFPCSATEHGNLLRDLIIRYHAHPNQFIHDGKPLISTFGGEFCTFGTNHMDDGWRIVLKTNLLPIHFVPSYFIKPTTFPSLKAIDGAFCWDSGWPMGNNDINSKYDDEYLRNLPGRTYMAAVSPWFFTHYSRETYNKNFIYRGDDWLWVERWELLIKARNSIDFVQVISWNDYGESHYIGPIDGAQPQSESWTNGFDHQGWLDLMHYYIEAYKTGSYPHISKDRIFLWGRLYPSKANAPDAVGRPQNADFTQDFIWAIALAMNKGRVELTCGNSHLATDVHPGVNKIKLPLTENCSPHALMTRDGKTMVDFRPSGYNFRRDPPMYNFNAFVAASPA